MSVVWETCQLQQPTQERIQEQMHERVQEQIQNRIQEQIQEQVANSGTFQSQSTDVPTKN